MLYWGKHRHVMGKSRSGGSPLKIGGGAAPIETDEGHGCCSTTV